MIADKTANVSPPVARFSPDVLKLTEEAYERDARSVIETLPNPVSTYYVRCNSNRISPEELKARLVGKDWQVSPHPAIPEALGIRVEGPFNVEPTGREVVVDRLTAESVLQGAHVYAPGIVNSGRVNLGDRVTVVSELGDILATGEMEMNSHEILTFRKGLAVRVEQRKYKAPQIREMPEFSEGFLYPQSLAAMTASRVLDPQPGETILDMNCAPGGKLSHISQLMHNAGKIVGLDRNAEKIEATRQTITALGCSNVTISIHDSRYADVDFVDLEPDRVMVDPPCSALGLRPKIYDRTTQQRVDDLATYQRQFLRAAGRVVRPGGTVVYSVCTYTKPECEGVVRFAKEQCGLHLVEQSPFLASTDAPQAGALWQRFNPARDEIGYFIAKFQR